MAKNLHYVDLKNGETLIVDLSDARLYFRDGLLCIYNMPYISGRPDEMPMQGDSVGFWGVKVRKSDFPVTVFDSDFNDHAFRPRDVVSISPARTSPDGELIH